MYPLIALINKNSSRLIVFERDINNPINEGFIIYWGINKSNEKHLIFKKRLTTLRARKNLSKLEDEGWIKLNGLDKVA